MNERQSPTETAGPRDNAELAGVRPAREAVTVDVPEDTSQGGRVAEAQARVAEVAVHEVPPILTRRGYNETVEAVDQVLATYEEGSFWAQTYDVVGILRDGDDAAKSDVRERIAAFRAELENQERVLADLTQELEDTISKNPDISLEELWDKVAKAAPEGRFNSRILDRLYNVVDGYVVRHSIVEHYRQTYPDDRKLIQQALGFVPEGEVEVIATPISFVFAFKGNRDYAAAVHERPHEHLTGNMRERANLTGGYALQRVQNPGLDNLIIIVNDSYADFEDKTVEEQLEILPKDGVMYPLTKADQIVASYPGGRRWQIDRTSLLKQDEEWFEVTGPDDPENPETAFIVSGGVVRRPGDTSGRYQMQVMPEEDGQSVSMTVRGDTLELYNNGSEPMEVGYRGRQAVMTRERIRPTSRVVVAHELRHHKNGMDEYVRPPDYELTTKLTSLLGARHPKTDELMFSDERIARELTLAEAHYWRADLMDRRARDEISAYVTDGSKLSLVRKLLTKEGPDALYDYAHRHAAQIARLPEEIRERYSEAFRWGRGQEVVKLLEPESMKAIISQVFGPDYKRDVRRWLEAVGMLEEKGYTRQEIVTVFQQKSVNQWVAYAWRAEDRTGSGKQWMRPSATIKRNLNNLFGALPQNRRITRLFGLADRPRRR